MHDTLAGRSRVQYEEYTPDEARELEEKVKMYLDGELQEIEVSSLRMVYEAFGCFRRLYQQLGTELASRPAAASQQAEGAAQAPDGGPAAQQGHEPGREGEVGEDEEGR